MQALLDELREGLGKLAAIADAIVAPSEGNDGDTAGYRRLRDDDVLERDDICITNDVTAIDVVSSHQGYTVSLLRPKFPTYEFYRKEEPDEWTYYDSRHQRITTPYQEAEILQGSRWVAVSLQPATFVGKDHFGKTIRGYEVRVKDSKHVARKASDK
jgi:hypothetical protein